MGKKKDEAAVREKAISRFFMLRKKFKGIHSVVQGAGEERDSAHHMMEKFKADLAYLKSLPLFVGKTREESLAFVENRQREIDDVSAKVDCYQALKDDADRRYWEFANLCNSFGGVFDGVSKAVVELGFLTKEEVR